MRYTGHTSESWSKPSSGTPVAGDMHHVKISGYWQWTVHSCFVSAVYLVDLHFADCEIVHQQQEQHVTGSVGCHVSNAPCPKHERPELQQHIARCCASVNSAATRFVTGEHLWTMLHAFAHCRCGPACAYVPGRSSGRDVESSQTYSTTQI